MKAQEVSEVQKWYGSFESINKKSLVFMYSVRVKSKAKGRFQSKRGDFQLGGIIILISI